MNRKLFIPAALVVGALSATPALASHGELDFDPAPPGDKVTICHIAGLAQPDNANAVTITISEHAAFGPAGHFNEDGTTQAGHEEDYFGPCVEPSPSPDPSPDPSPEPPVRPNDPRDPKLPDELAYTGGEDVALGGILLAGLLGLSLVLYRLSRKV